MKFNMMIGGVETFFPENDVCYFKEKNKMVIYFLKIKEEYLEKIKQNIFNISLRLEENYLILLIKDFQYAIDTTEYPNLLGLYNSGVSMGIAFEDESGKILDIKTPVFHV